jgi:hypothetical protein
MAAPLVHFDASLHIGKAVAGPIVVGKDVLELLSSAMYIDPLSIVREYAQNAADSIELAYCCQLLGEDDGRIDVEVHETNRELVIRDNGVGIPAVDVERVLGSFGASEKRGRGLRGFRGVGRLGGLGYARALTFRTRAAGDPTVTEVKWDCRELREQLRVSAESKTLEEVVRRVVTIEEYPAPESTGRHFFEVRLEGVVRLWNDTLLNRESIASYLTQVCPIPLAHDMPFKAEIESHIGSNMAARYFRIFINGATTSIYRPYRSEFLVSGSKRDHFVDCQLLRFAGMDGETSAVGWILHHNYLGAIKATPEIRGLRARVGGIQVGKEDIFVNAFPESRFNSWIVGELHILDPRIVPNGRRDDFEHNPSYTNLLNQLIPLGRDIARRCRGSSAMRSRMKTFDHAEKEVQRTLSELRRGFTRGRSLKSVLREADAMIKKMTGIAGNSLFSDGTSGQFEARLRRIERARQKILKTPHKATTLGLVPPEKRRFYQLMASLVLDCAPSRTVAERILKKTAERLAGQRKRTA